MKTYTYKGIEYKSESQLRKAVWLKDRIALPEVKTNEDWEKHGVTVTTVADERKPIDPEQVAHYVRRTRDKLLSESDYYVMSDYPSTIGGLFDVKAYRQALRDITNQEGFPMKVEWPQKPSVLG